jgi:hypothetical protein
MSKPRDKETTQSRNLKKEHSPSDAEDNRVVNVSQNYSK